MKKSGGGAGDDIPETKVIHAGEDEEEEVTITTFLTQQLDKFFINHIPVESVQELPPGYLYHAGMIAYIAAFSLFAYFVYSSYQSAMNQAFIAVDESSGNYESGNWEGSPQFGYSFAKYTVNFNNFQVTSFSQYQQMMGMYYESLVIAGNIAQQQNLPFNLLMWVTFVHYYSVEYPFTTNFTSIGYGQLQSIEMTGSAQQIYNLPNQIVNTGSHLGACPVHAQTDFDMANAIIKTDLTVIEFMNHSTCYLALPPEQFGYANNVDDGYFNVDLNVETFALAMSVNLGFIQISDLTVASSEKYYLHFHNASYLMGQYYDQRNIEMDPMWCLSNVTVIPVNEPQIEHLCFYSKSRAVAVPVMHHFGGSFSEPEYCDCATIGKGATCNGFNLISGLLYYPIQNSRAMDVQTLISQQIVYLLTLIAGFDSYEAFNHASYNASWTLAAEVYGRQDANYTTSAWYQDAFAFARIASGLNGSLLVFNSMDTISHMVSTYKYSLNNGSCVDSFSIPLQDWSQLAQTSPVQLTQSYFKCYPTSSSAFFNALGIASGNTQLAVPLIVVLLLPMLYGFLSLINYVPPKEEYNKLDREEALDVFAMLLLRLRDGKTRGIKPKGVLMSLIKEMVSAAKEEGGFPDSDDEEEYEDEEVKNRKSSSDKKAAPKPAAGKMDSDDEYDDADNGEDYGYEDDVEANRPTQVKKRPSARKRKSDNMDIRMSTSRNSIGTTKKKKNQRQRMGAFVKQIEDGPRAEATRRASAKRVAKPPVPPPDSVFGYFFGSQQQQQSNPMRETMGVELATNPMRKFLDLTTDSIPYNIQIMNSQADHHGTLQSNTRTIQGNSLEPLVDDLLRNFMEAMNSKDDDGNSGLAVAKESPAYAMGCSIAKRLAQVDFDSFLSHENPVLHLKLANALCMNASIELFCEMRQIESQFADRIAYNIGNKVVTAAALSSMLSE